MDRKRNFDSIDGEGVGESESHTSSIISEEIESIIQADDYKRLQAIVENGKIKDIDITITVGTDKSLLMVACEAGSI